MNVTINVYPVKNPDASNLKAMASLSLEGVGTFGGFRIVEGRKGLFLTPPTENRNGKWHPVNRMEQHFLKGISERAVADFKAKMAEA